MSITEEQINEAYLKWNSNYDSGVFYAFKAGVEWKNKLPVWIDVYDNLPETEGGYLVVVENNEVGISHFYKDDDEFNGFAYPGVKYWMPLPEAPKDNSGTAESA